MRRPLVTIGLPFRNPGRWLEEAIRSVFAQTYQEWELLLVDDGSDDGSTERAARIKDSRVRLLCDGMHRGLVARLNQIAQLASGEYLARMDADDLMHPERLQRQVAILEQKPEVDIVATAAIVLDIAGEPVGYLNFARHATGPRGLLGALKWGAVLHPTITGRRHWFLAHPYDPRYPRAEDRELFVRTWGQTCIRHVSDPLYFYRFVGGVRVQAFLESYRSERKILLRYAPDLLGWMPTLRLYLRSLSKSAALRGLAVLGQHQRLFARKGVPLTVEQRAAASRVLMRIRKTSVPGWSD
ncbi:glycosyltransferase family 2 protein [Rhodothermus marinus]|uniref:glycosyltransferase family 2 protein n=1 Tax=Rhodothermus marinus TaxID=29549 RepID=UPI0012BA4465|nr:glycosyltransferase family 2 protein [Rhodothermus marinus]BBM69009.1 hypothetical protein RmaAA213_08550 [Rhodothermus marinus]